MNPIPSIAKCDIFWHVPMQGPTQGTGNSDTDPVKVGTLARANNHLYFAYDQEWLALGIEISPSSLPISFGTTPVSLTDSSSSAYVRDLELRNELRGLPGPFYDSLPDKWGMTLLSRHTGKDADELAATDILCHRGNRCMGAFSYEPAFGRSARDENLFALDIDLYCRQAAFITSGNEPESLEDSVLDALEDSGGSAGGMRPKMLLAIHSASLARDSAAEIPTLRKLTGYDHHDMPSDFSPWLLKFDTDPEKFRGRIEQACALMARAAGVELPETTVIDTHSSGVRRSHFAVKRFDRELVNGKWRRVHMHTAAGMLQRDFNALDLDYTDLLELTRILTNDPVQIRQIYTRAVFNVLAGNSDDHAKNHAFLFGADGQWKISPAYDLTPSSLRLQPGIRSTSVLGEKREKIPLRLLLELADHHEIEKPKEIIQVVSDAIRQWGSFAKAAGVPESIYRRYGERMAKIHPPELKGTGRKPPGSQKKNDDPSR
ncbi:MAG: type II toxin-antitoxin system HipA family toxin [Luteolibacter sp.]